MPYDFMVPGPNDRRFPPPMPQAPSLFGNFAENMAAGATGPNVGVQGPPPQKPRIGVRAPVADEEASEASQMPTLDFSSLLESIVGSAVGNIPAGAPAIQKATGNVGVYGPPEPKKKVGVRGRDLVQARPDSGYEEPDRLIVPPGPPLNIPEDYTQTYSGGQGPMVFDKNFFTPGGPMYGVNPYSELGMKSRLLQQQIAGEKDVAQVRADSQSKMFRQQEIDRAALDMRMQGKPEEEIKRFIAQSYGTSQEGKGREGPPVPVGPASVFLDQAMMKGGLVGAEPAFKPEEMFGAISGNVALQSPEAIADLAARMGRSGVALPLLTKSLDKFQQRRANSALGRGWLYNAGSVAPSIDLASLFTGTKSPLPPFSMPMRLQHQTEADLASQLLKQLSALQPRGPAGLAP